MSSKKSTHTLKSGDEPTGLLLALVSSPLETLIERKAASVYLANGSDGQPVVLAIFDKATWQDGLLVLATNQSVGNQPKIANTQEKTA